MTVEPRRSDAPLGAAEFSRLLDALGPFEAAPVLAVAVSGGADSLALTFLTAGWAADRQGRVIGLTVDHGLRPESAAEAGRVIDILARRGIEGVVLPWQGPKPGAGLQAAARAARYALLERWCRRHGVLHLLLAHHLDDQAETVLLRLGRGSGVAGLAGMAPVTERRAVRLLRPLLTVPKARLTASLSRPQESWIDDPSNASSRFARSRIRALSPQLSAAGLTPSRIAGTARRLGRARQAVEQEVAVVLARGVRLRPEGYARLDLVALRDRPLEIGLRVLAALLSCVGGLAYASRLERLERLYAALLAPSGSLTRTLGGCLLRRQGDDVLVCREPECLPPPVPVEESNAVLWDGRFELRIAGRGRGILRALGSDGWRDLAARGGGPAGTSLPAAVGYGLPSLWDDDGIVAVPHLRYGRVRSTPDSVTIAHVAFRPPHPLQAAGFMLV